MLNEACSSGCGSFIQTFALALGYDIADFASLGLFAENPVDLGSRCTVFMNKAASSRHRRTTVQLSRTSPPDSPPQSLKMPFIKLSEQNRLKNSVKNIVVQGGTFLNDAVLRAFEMEMGRNVIRPAISGLMGAFGAALYAKEKKQTAVLPQFQRTP